MDRRDTGWERDGGVVEEIGRVGDSNSNIGISDS